MLHFKNSRLNKNKNEKNVKKEKEKEKKKGPVKTPFISQMNVKTPS